MSQRYYNRFCRIKVDNIEVDALDVQFEIEKNDKPEPNKCAFQIWNLGPDKRGELLRQHGIRVDKSTRTPVHVEADIGYEDEHGNIFSGDLQNLDDRHEGPDRVVVIDGGDGAHKFKTAQVKRSFAKRTPLVAIIKACADALGYGVGNLNEKAAQADILNLGRTMPHAYVLSGPAWRELDELLDSCDLGWSIQNNTILVLGKDEALNRKVIKLSPSSGLVGTPKTVVLADVIPSKGKVPKVKTALEVVALLHPGYTPRQKLQLESEGYDGDYLIKEVKFAGVRHGANWYAHLKLQPFKEAA